MLVAYALLGIGGLLTLLLPSRRNHTFSRSGPEWAIDLISLGVHFFAIPVATGWVIYLFRKVLVPEYEGILDPSPLVGVLGGLLFTDYLWYWNHRAFHAPTRFWNLHEVHHNSRVFDIFMSARNSVASPLFFVYMWAIAVGTIVLKDPSCLVTAAAIALVINFWGHTDFAPRPGSRPHRVLAWVLITPHEHAWHHSSDDNNRNFATVFSFWDRLHGTYYSPAQKPASYGFVSQFPYWKQVVFPFFA